MEQGFQVLLQVFGGLALFLYGTDSLCRAVQQGAGRRLRIDKTYKFFVNFCLIFPHSLAIRLQKEYAYQALILNIC